MKSPGTVTRLQHKRRARKPASSVDELMEHCREHLRNHMKGALPGIMDQVDDALFDLADKADSNKLQSVYFEAMRSVRLCRDEIESRFVSELDAAMLRKSVSESLPGNGAALESGAITLSLVAEDDMEETVAVRNIASKIANLYHDDLFALDRRVALLLDSPDLQGEDNPLGPHVLCSAARNAVDIIEANVEIRLLVLKLFDRHLTQAAGKCYPQINAWLVQKDVLPDVRTSAPVRARGSVARQARPTHNRGGVQISAGGDRGSDPAHDRRGDDRAFGHERYQGDGGQDYQGTAAVLEPAGERGIRAEQVLGMLEQIMRINGAAHTGEDSPGRENFIENLTSMQRDSSLADAGNLVRDLKPGDVSHSDDLMIDLVAMMFDFILEDENIDDTIRALIGRLQIPVLKVAILDRNFFARRSHPARGFINALAEFGAHADSDDPQREAAQMQVQELVKRILNEFEDQIDVFSGALEELQAIVVADEDAAKRNAWASTKVAEERERLVRARRIADDHVEERLQQAEPREVVADFLREHWRHLLGERLFQDGEQGEPWREGLRTMDRLLWSVTPKTGPASRKRLLAMLPFLLERLKTGMRELGMSEESLSGRMQEFSQLHIAALKETQTGFANEPAGSGDDDAGERVGPGIAAVPVQAQAVTAQEPCDVQPEPISVAGVQAQRILQDAVECANDMVWATAEERAQCQGMGATVVALKLDGDRLVCAHAGDSRLYRIRDGVQTQLSVDHTYRNDMLARGLVSEADSAATTKNMITRAVGGDSTIEVEVNVHDTVCGDLFLCCSDGLSDMLDDERIVQIVLAADGLQAMVEALIAAANEAGGRDNISIGLLRVDETLPGSGAATTRDYGAYASAVVATDSGRSRAHNEDCIDCDLALGAMVLADGMGGHNAGEVASAMTVSLVLEAIRYAVSAIDADQPDAEMGDQPGFDFDSIDAQFWGDQVPPTDNNALYEAVRGEVQCIAECADDNLDIFDLDQDVSPGSGDLRVHVLQDAARDPLLDRVLKLGCGVWVEFGEPGGKRVRARLSWIAPERARYLFTDRRGQKVSEATPYGLAVELRAGRMRVLNNAPLFDRAVSSLAVRLHASDLSTSQDQQAGA